MPLRTAVLAVLLLIVPCPLAAQDAAPPREKSPRLARDISLVAMGLPMAIAGEVGGTAGLVLAVGGLVLGPTAGFIYAGEIPMALPGVGIRAVTTGATLGAISRYCGDRYFFPFGDKPCFWGALLIGVVGSGITAGHAFYDIRRLENRLRERIPERNDMIRVLGANEGWGTGEFGHRPFEDIEPCEPDSASNPARPLAYSVLAGHARHCAAAP